MTPSILIFDSGVGGLSVYHEIRQKLPDAHYIYTFDNEAFPYGDKSEPFLIERVNHVIQTILSHYSIDIIVIACNTASTLCLKPLRQAISIPIVGVVPAIKPAVSLTRNGVIGLLATKGTIQRAYTHHLINEFAPNVKVELLGLSELAIFAERKLYGEAVNLKKLRELMSPWLQLKEIPDTIILGCTHYPFIREELEGIFPNSILIDSGYAIANRVLDLSQSLIKTHHQEENSLRPLLLSTAEFQQKNQLLELIDSFNFKQYKTIVV